MARKSQLIKKINLAGRVPFANLPVTSIEDDNELAVMSDARYLRQSAALISAALQKGFDVLQMANGDIITTGTKIVVYTYGWDTEKGKLIRSKVKSKKDKLADAEAAAGVELEELDELEDLS